MDVPPFGDWLEGHVRGVLDHNEDIVCLSQPSSLVAHSYPSMWAYDNHY
jgi:hypothetical protein